MRNLNLIIHTSLDGFVAHINGELNGFESGDENLGFVCKLTVNADALLYGRKTYEMLYRHWPSMKDKPTATGNEKAYSEWYCDAKQIVVSKTLNELSAANSQLIKNNVIEEIAALKQTPGKDILIFGSPSIAQLCIRANLINRYWIFINPVIFGKGIPLFKDLSEQNKLKLLSSHQFTNGEIALEYEV